MSWQLAGGYSGQSEIALTDITSDVIGFPGVASGLDADDLIWQYGRLPCLSLVKGPVAAVSCLERES